MYTMYSGETSCSNKDCIIGSKLSTVVSLNKLHVRNGKPLYVAISAVNCIDCSCLIRFLSLLFTFRKAFNRRPGRLFLSRLQCPVFIHGYICDSRYGAYIRHKYNIYMHKTEDWWNLMEKNSRQSSP